MKTMLTLIAMLVAGSAFGEPIFTEEDMHRISQENRAFYDRLSSGPKMSDSIRSNDEASKPMKVDYSIVTLPDGKTASVLTFK